CAFYYYVSTYWYFDVW
nr:immunoglobulin heavy chain junction region [Mus musculus]MBK4186639.1 immunoglobulin heavy chain junction region [Mus musculus]